MDLFYLIQIYNSKYKGYVSYMNMEAQEGEGQRNRIKSDIHSITFFQILQQYSQQSVNFLSLSQL